MAIRPTKSAIRSQKKIDKLSLTVRKTGIKYQTLRDRFDDQLKRFKATGKHVSIPLVHKLEDARYRYEKLNMTLKKARS